jgi:YD repeat-containing protein
LTHKGQEELDYDLNGNLIRWKRGSKTTTYTYDALDRLIAIDNGQKTTYQYDAFNRRVSRNHEELFVYQGQDEMGAGKMAVFKSSACSEKIPTARRLQ